MLFIITALPEEPRIHSSPGRRPQKACQGPGEPVPFEDDAIWNAVASGGAQRKRLEAAGGVRVPGRRRAGGGVLRLDGAAALRRVGDPLAPRLLFPPDRGVPLGAPLRLGGSRSPTPRHGRPLRPGGQRALPHPRHVALQGPLLSLFRRHARLHPVLAVQGADRVVCRRAGRRRALLHRSGGDRRRPSACRAAAPFSGGLAARARLRRRLPRLRLAPDSARGGGAVLPGAHLVRHLPAGAHAGGRLQGRPHAGTPRGLVCGCGPLLRAVGRGAAQLPPWSGRAGDTGRLGCGGGWGGHGRPPTAARGVRKGRAPPGRRVRGAAHALQLVAVRLGGGIRDALPAGGREGHGPEGDDRVQPPAAPARVPFSARQLAIVLSVFRCAHDASLRAHALRALVVAFCRGLPAHGGRRARRQGWGAPLRLGGGRRGADQPWIPLLLLRGHLALSRGLLQRCAPPGGRRGPRAQPEGRRAGPWGRGRPPPRRRGAGLGLLRPRRLRDLLPRQGRLLRALADGGHARIPVAAGPWRELRRAPPRPAPA